ncbi:hypothetical protein ACHAWF_011733 [Thalassiosira exigua]
MMVAILSLIVTTWAILGTYALVIEPNQRAAAIQNQPPSEHHRPLQRRGALGRALLLTVPIAAASRQAGALEACKPKSHNCIRSTWTAPPTLSVSEVAATLRDTLNSYPLQGQAGVDCNGWRVVRDALDENAGVVVLEYRSCVGPAALAVNLGQPFIDDLKLELGKSSSGEVLVEVKSSSRMGSSDLFVNRKRLQYLGGKLKEKGWSVPDPKYVYEK